MGRKASAELRELWAQRLERQAASGSSIAEFCVAEGISAGSFSSWKRRLQAAADGATPAPCRAGESDTIDLSRHRTACRPTTVLM